MARWTASETNLLSEFIDSAKSIKEVYDRYCIKFGSTRTYDSIQKKIKSLSEPKNIMITSSPPSINSKEYKTQLKANKEKASEWIRELLEVGHELLPDGEFLQVKTPESNSQTLCVVISDVHSGKRTPYYDIEMMQERLESIPSRIAKDNIIDINNIKEIKFLFCGDLVDGEDIHPTQNISVICPSFFQLQYLVESTLKMFNATLRIFPNAFISTHSVLGNHGRISKTASPVSNWDNVFTYSLSLVTALNKNINVHQYYEEFNRVKIRDVYYLMNHHGVKHLGTPATAVRIAGWKVSEEIDGFIHGHWHQPGFNYWLNTPVISNGSLCGPDDLSKKIAKNTKAAQAYFVIGDNENIKSCSFIDWE